MYFFANDDISCIGCNEKGVNYDAMVSLFRTGDEERNESWNMMKEKTTKTSILRAQPLGEKSTCRFSLKTMASALLMTPETGEIKHQAAISFQENHAVKILATGMIVYRGELTHG